MMKYEESRQQGINRNIVECKLSYDGDLKLDCYCINRNIVECKFAFETFVPGCDNFVLIETLWNVNAIIDCKKVCSYMY